MSIDLPCAWKSGFVMNPSEKQRVGYLVAFEGLNMGEYLKQDIDVFTPYNNSESEYGEVTVDTENTKVTVVGVLDHFSFGGGVGDPLTISAYISAENAQVLSAKMKTTLDTTIVSKLAWWIVNFDEENKIWFEEAYPKDPTTVKGQLNAPRRLGGAPARRGGAHQGRAEHRRERLQHQLRGHPRGGRHLQLPLRELEQDEVREELGAEDRHQRGGGHGQLTLGPASARALPAEAAPPAPPLRTTPWTTRDPSTPPGCAGAWASPCCRSTSTPRRRACAPRSTSGTGSWPPRSGGWAP
jgi:hypothetical protein